MWLKYIWQSVEGILATVGLWQAIRWPIFAIWPDRSKWIAEFRHNGSITKTLELQGTLSKDRRASWTSPSPQSIGDAYAIDLGTPRVIDGVEFYEMFPSNEIPSKWTLLLMNEWQSLVARPINGEGSIVQAFQPTKLSRIEIGIREPMMKKDGTIYPWRIQNVYLREVKLFHRWIRMRI